MKKKILGIVIVVAALAAGWNLSQNGEDMTLSDIAFSNVEALARNESNDNQNPCRWKTVSCGFWSGSQEACLRDGDGNSCSCGSVSRDC